MDLVQDWQDIMLEDIRKEGLSFSLTQPRDTLIIRYFTYLRKQGPKKPCTIFKSREFYCPPQLRKGLKQIETLLKRGEDISLYLSKDVENLKEDLMFNDWGVLHLHLGDTLDKKKNLIKRTGPLLFIYFKDAEAYFINIFQHKEWTKKAVIQTIYDNWPDLITPFKLNIPEFQGFSPEFSESDHLKLRTSHMNVMLEIKDEYGNRLPLMPPGMGLVSSGDSMKDVRSYQYQVNEIRKIEDTITENIGNIARNQSLKGIPTNRFYFRLIYFKGSWKVLEVNSGLLLNVVQEVRKY